MNPLPVYAAPPRQGTYAVRPVIHTLSVGNTFTTDNTLRSREASSAFTLCPAQGITDDIHKR